MNEIKGKTEHKVMLASGAVTGPEKKPVDLSFGLVTGLLIVALLVVCTVVMVTAPFWLLHS